MLAQKIYIYRYALGQPSEHKERLQSCDADLAHSGGVTIEMLMGAYTYLRSIDQNISCGYSGILSMNTVA